MDLKHDKEFTDRVKKAIFEKSGFAYCGSKKGSPYIDKVYEDGARITGMLIDGKFIESKDIEKFECSNLSKFVKSIIKKITKSEL